LSTRALTFLQAVVDALQRVGRVLGVGVVQLEQHVLGVLDQRRDAARAQAQQAEHRQVLAVDREQHVVVQDEGHAHVARASSSSSIRKSERMCSSPLSSS
jgi:hypothetical protein